MTSRGFDVWNIGLVLFGMFWKLFKLMTRLPFLKKQIVRFYGGNNLLCQCWWDFGILLVFLLSIIVLIQKKRFQNDQRLLRFVVILLSVLICAVML